MERSQAGRTAPMLRLDENDVAALKQITLKGPFLNYALRNDLFELAALVSRLDAAFRKVSFPEERTV